MLKRLQADFQLTIVLLFGFFSSALITPFAAYRFLTGNIIVGILDTVLVAVIAGVVVYGWKSGHTERTGRFLVIISGLGAMMSSELLGVVGVFWMYVAIVANFFLTTKRNDSECFLWDSRHHRTEFFRLETIRYRLLETTITTP